MNTKILTKETATIKKPKKSLSDIQNFKNANKNLSQTIRDIEIVREIIDKTRQELARRS
jgi:hypothetical protein